VEAPSRPPARRALTPAVLLAALFATACAGVSIAFTAARGGLQVPPPAGSGLVAAASPSSAEASPAATTEPTGVAAISPVPSLAVPSATPAGPSVEPTPIPSIDPLAALPACPDHPGCYLYTVRRGDTLSTISDRWLIGLWIVEALNSQIADPSTIVVGQTLYLGRTPFVRLDRCPDTPGCYLYVVKAGDRLSTIAGRFGTSTSAILELNPGISDPNQIYSGQTIRLPGPA
jgi:nucleoid-associated protein YgaU